MPTNETFGLAIGTQDNMMYSFEESGTMSLILSLNKKSAAIN
jgi:hypothetical protein